MEWIRIHAYVSTLIVAAVLIAAGAFVVEGRTPISPSQSTITWSGGGVAPATYPYTNTESAQTPQEIAQDVIQNNGSATLSLPLLSSSSSTASFSPTSNSFNYVALLAELSGSAQASSSVGTSQGESPSATIAQAYQFIPTGLIATTAPAQKPMTADQQALYDYGNEVGGEIQSFEALHTNQTEVLKDQAEDRTDPTKAAALVSLGQSIAAVGTYMQQMQDVPAAVTSQHNALAQSYIDIGGKLQLVAQAQGDAAFVQAVENYDTAADTFVRNYAALAQFFSAQGIAFSSQDPGSVFSFTDASAGGGL